MAEVYWPTLSQGSVLVTTRNKDLSLPLHVPDQIISLSLLPMSTDASKAFLKQSLEHHEAQDDDLERISTLLGGIPLALAHVAECIKAAERVVRNIDHALEALQGRCTSIEDIWSIDHRQDPENLQSWPYGRLPRQALDQVLSSLNPIALSLLGSLVIFDVPTPLSLWPEKCQEASHPYVYTYFLF